ncbi:MAG: hypothetical protein R3B47_06475 [Bacteroidia bacterium]
MAIYVGRWDCPTCGTIGNLGPETRCPNCGASRPEDVHFYLATDAEVVRDKRRLAAAKAGADWRCGHCSSHNKAGSSVCQTCGNPRDQYSEDIELSRREYGPGQAPSATPSGPSTLEQYEESVRKHNAGRFRKLRPIIAFAFVGLLALVLSGFLPTGVDARVVGFSWERITSMEHYEAVSYEDWSAPSNAFDIESFRAVHHYEKEYSHTETRYRDVRVQVGTETYVCGKVDMGNGYFQDRYCTRPVYTSRSEPYQYDVYRDVPVYATKYAYKVMQWVKKPAYALRAEGNDHEAQWPQPPLSLQSEDWRKGGNEARYFVRVMAGKEHTPRRWGLAIGKACARAMKCLQGAHGFTEPGYGLSDPAHRQNNKRC